MNETAAATMTQSSSGAPGASGWGLTLFKIGWEAVFLVGSLLLTLWAFRLMLQMMNNLGGIKHGIRLQQPTSKILLRRMVCRHRHCSVIRQGGFMGLFCTRCGSRQDVGQAELQR